MTDEADCPMCGTLCFKEDKRCPECGYRVDWYVFGFDDESGSEDEERGNDP